MTALIFTGNSNPALVDKISHNVMRRRSEYATTSLWTSDVARGVTNVGKFSNGEIRVEIQDNVRGLDTFIVQSTCEPINDSIMELLLLADALRRSSAATITAVIPHFGYARQDRRPGYSRVPISARLIADMIEAAGIDHVVLVDVHSTQTQGFFKIPVDNISANQLFVADIYKNWIHDNPIIVSPDVGGVARARIVAKQLGDVDLAIVDKRRPAAGISEVMNIIGDVQDRTCILVDDMVDSAGTLCKAADALMAQGARRVVAYCTHGVLSGDAFSNLDTNISLEQLVITDTIPLAPHMALVSKIRQLSISQILAETINRIANKQSVSDFLE